MYQSLVDAYRLTRPEVVTWALSVLIDQIGSKVSARSPELNRLGSTLKRHRVNILAYFHHLGTPDGPKEALNGRSEHLPGIALGFRKFAHYIAQSLVETARF